MPELLAGVSHQAYHADELPGAPHFSRSVAQTILERSLYRAWQLHPKLGAMEEVEDDPQKLARKERGELIHKLLLGAGRGVAVIEGFADYKKDAAKVLRDEARANGLVPVLEGKYQVALATARAFERRIVELGVPFAECQKEVTALWEIDGVACKARIDLLGPDVAHVWDPKVSDQTPDAFKRAMDYNGLSIQAWLYANAIESCFPELGGRVTFEFLLCDPKSEDVAIVPVGATKLSLGEMQARRALKLWAEALATGKWPGYGRVSPAEASSFALTAEMERGIDGDPDWVKGD